MNRIYSSRNTVNASFGWLRVWIAVVVAGAGISLLTYASIRASARQYVRVDKLVNNPDQFDGRRIKLTGTVVKDTSSYKKKDLELTFRVRNNDGEGSTREQANVIFNGTKPDAFKEGGVVIIKGHYEKEHNRIIAEGLQAKCPSRYKKKSGEESEQYGDQKQTDQDSNSSPSTEPREP